MKNSSECKTVHCCNCNNIMKLYVHSGGRTSGQCPVCKTVMTTSVHKKEKEK